MIKDSGTRREFETGAVRDMAEGKGDMYSLPAAAIIRLSKHYELGAKKYTRLNYQKGIPISSFLDSALRHIFKYLDGCDDEDHLSAAAFNVLGAIQMEERNPDMQDVEARKNPGLRRERAAEEDINSVRMCRTCKHFLREFGMGGIECKIPCATIRHENFEWRGIP